MLFVAALCLVASLLSPDDDVTVTLSAPADLAVELRMHESFANAWQGEAVASARIDADGSATLRAEVPGASTAVLVVGDAFRRVWIAPGTLDVTPRDDAWRFDGTLGADNALLEALRSRAWPAFDGDDWEAFRDAVDAERDVRGALVAEAVGARDDVFARYAHALVVAEAANTLGNSLALAAFAPVVALPDDAARFWRDVPLFDDDVGAVCDPCRRAVAGRLGHVTQAAGYDPSVDRGAWVLATLERYAERLAERPRTHELVATSLVDFAIQYVDQPSANAAVRVFARHFPASDALPSLEAALLAAHGVDVDALAASVSFVDVAGRTRTLDELRGRVVYVDLWGAWCAACMALSGDLRDLADALPDDVVILGVDMLDAADTWRATVASKRLPGEQWKPATADDEARLTELLALRAYPRFVILGRDGALVSASAPPPREALAALLDAADA